MKEIEMRGPAKTITMPIPIPVQVFFDLCAHREKTGCKREIYDMAGQAIEQWLARQTHATGNGDQVSGRTLSGYQWKRLFLPDGTMLRSTFKGESYFAQVKAGKIIDNGQAHSPSGFANAAGSSGRNAWKSIWLLLPGECGWRQAADCRPIRAPAHTLAHPLTRPLT